MHEFLGKEVGDDDSDVDKAADRKIAKGNFDFRFQIKKEGTKIDPDNTAMVSVILSRFDKSIGRSKDVDAVYELVWVNKHWVITKSYFEKEMR